MASHTSAQASREKDSSSPPPPPLTRPRRMKSTPKKYNYGVDKQIPGIPSFRQSSTPRSKGVSFEEPSKNTPSIQPETQSAGAKGKRKVGESSKPPTGKKSKSQSRGKNQSQGSREGTPSVNQSSEEIETIPGAISEIYLHTNAPQGFVLENSYLSHENSAKFKETYMKKEFCPVVSVDLAKLREECNVDLSPWLKPYASFLSISAQFCPNMVRLFYFNMEWNSLEDSDHNLV